MSDYSSHTQRRIKDGFKVNIPKKYAVYFVKAPPAPLEYQGWTCGGAIISRYFILTAAACLEDVPLMYAIAGYKYFVPNKKLAENQCTRHKKKRVVFTCVPKNYHFEYKRTENWARADIGVAKVESPYDFTDTSYEKYCTYTPAPIPVNYEPQFQKPGSDVMALGWGHAVKFGNITDLSNFNQKILHYAATRILDKDICVQYFKDNKNMDSVIRSYMICTLERGNLNDRGDLIHKSVPNLDGCITEKEKMMGLHGKVCDKEAQAEEEKEKKDNSSEVPFKWKRLGEYIRKDGRKQNKDRQRKAVTRPLRHNKQRNSTMRSVRTPGICQNDHGGPLVSWMGAHEILIGVATLFKLDEEMQCMGPYLFTSTQCNSAFLDCILSMDNEIQPKRRCVDPDAHAQNTVQRSISWARYPAGPIQTEIIYQRHQVPLRLLHPEQG